MKTFLLARVSAGLVLGVAMMVFPAVVSGATVNVATSGFTFSPADVTINVGDTVHWSIGSTHDVTSDAGQAESFSSSLGPTTLDHTFTQVGRFTYFCGPHLAFGMVGSVTVQPPPNQPPIVSITSPANGAVLPANSPVTISADASDPDPGGGVLHVEFFDGGTSLGTATSFPWEVTVSSLAAGSHTFTARAMDNVGAQTTSASVTVTGNTPPSVSISSPTGGSTLATNFPVTIKANASDIDPGGSVTSVQFFDGATSLGTATSSPFQVTVNNLSPGPHTLTARATDNLNTQTTSSGVTVTLVAPAQLRITSTERRTPNLVLAFASTPGLKYVIETNTVVPSVSWKPLVTNVATAASTSVTNPIGTSKVFYRVALVP